MLVIEMMLMFEKDLWGEIKQAVKYCAKANEKYMKEQYNLDKKKKHISSVFWM